MTSATDKPSCDECVIKRVFAIGNEHKTEASKLARETIKAARERRVDIGELIKFIANEYAAFEASYADRGAYAEGYDDGFNDGVTR